MSGRANGDARPGGGAPITGRTLAVWIKPAFEMGKSDHGGKGDVIGYARADSSSACTDKNLPTNSPPAAT